MCGDISGETDLVEDAQFLLGLSWDLFSSGLQVSIYGFFNSYSTEEKIHCHSLLIKQIVKRTESINIILHILKQSLRLLAIKSKSFVPSVCVALRVLGLVSWLVSELRVARGFATGAVERSEESLVQRRVNCRVGPWEKLSNGGKRYKIREIK